MGISFSIPAEEFPPFLRYLCLNNLEDNLEALQREMQDLNAMKDELLNRVLKEELRGVQRLVIVQVWISRVTEIESEANRLLDKSISVIQRLSTYGYCSLICASIYQYSKDVAMTLKQVRSLRFEGVFKLVAERGPPLEERPTLPPTVSQEKLLESVWHSLMERNVGTLGIYGMGGVGKTTLLTQINNKFVEVLGDAFDIVIFVVVASKEVENIQDEIGRRLGLQWGRETQKEKAAEILRVLKRERFVLLLDDLQRSVDLEDIGVPYPSRENGCKIVFTTRHRGSSNWEVDAEVKVECLPQQEAWDLFQKKVGVPTLASHPDIPALARIVAEKCRGLPLALSVVGESMACKRTVQEWRHAIHVLMLSSAQFQDFESILSVLKYSYDTLPGEKIKSCLLYCALFPEDGDIRRQDLVNYWVGEGMVSDDSKGFEMINDLVGAHLLMENKLGNGVKMHDVVREMALWIASDYGMQKKLFVVKGGEGIHEMPKDVSDWNMVKRMSVTFTQIQNISDSPHCSDLTTLFLQHNNLKWISGDFFRWMTSLVVLDLSHNRELSELPEEVSCLVSLRLLNLSGTSIKDFPNGLRVLTQLIHLDIESTSKLRSLIMISGLPKLQVLRFYGSKASLDRSLLEILKRLKVLELLTITVREVGDLKAFLGSKLARKTHGLYLEGLKLSEASFAATFGELGTLSKLEMVDCDIKESPSTSFNHRRRSNTWFKNLSAVVLLSCMHLKDLTWLIYAANLESLSIKNSPKLEEVISKEKAADVNMVEPFRNLQVLDLGDLAELESIYWMPLSFPRLQKVNITACPNLGKLPLNSTSVERINDLHIEVDDGWLDGVEWESGAEGRFRPFIHLVYVS